MEKIQRFGFFVKKVFKGFERFWKVHEGFERYSKVLICSTDYLIQPFQTFHNLSKPFQTFRNLRKPRNLFGKNFCFARLKGFKIPTLTSIQLTDYWVLMSKSLTFLKGLVLLWWCKMLRRLPSDDDVLARTRQIREASKGEAERGARLRASRSELQLVTHAPSRST